MNLSHPGGNLFIVFHARFQRSGSISVNIEPKRSKRLLVKKRLLVAW